MDSASAVLVILTSLSGYIALEDIRVVIARGKKSAATEREREDGVLGHSHANSH